MILDRPLAYPEGEGDAPGRNGGRVQQQERTGAWGENGGQRNTGGEWALGHDCDGYRTARQARRDRGSWSQQG